MIKSSPRISSTLITSSALASVLTAMPAAAVEENALEEVVIVGNRAEPRSASESAVPVDVFTASDLAQSGSMSGELNQLLHNLLPSFNFPRQSNSDTADLVRPAQMRGLSPDHTLVLINGKRRHTTAILNTGGKTGRGSAPVDLNTIPAAAIERIEVLRDGAAAQYGSDAIAGVINIVLKNDSEGGSVSLTYGEHDTNFDPRDEYRGEGLPNSLDKDINDGETVLVTANVGFSLGEDGFLNLSGQYRTRDETNRAGLDDIPFFEPFNEDLVDQRNYRPGDPEEDGYSLVANFGMETWLGQVYSIATWAEREATGSNFFRYPDTSANVNEVYPLGYLPENEGTATDYGVVAGIRGDEGEWQWDASVNYGVSEFDLDVINSLNSSLGVASPTSFHVGEYEYKQIVLNFDATRELALGSLPGYLALGAEFRWEDYETKAGEPASYAAGPNEDGAVGSQGIQGLRPSDANDDNRNSWAVYADYELQATDRLRLGFAGRYEDYDDFGDTFNGKLTFRFELTDTMALRGAASTGFRAPSLAQTTYQASSTDFGEGGALASIILLPATDPLALALGSEELDAEESENLSLGFVGTWDNLSLTVDLYRVEIEDRITLSEGIFADENGTPVSELPEAEAHPNVEGVSYFKNGVDTSTKGVDVVLQYTIANWLLGVAYNKSDTDVIKNTLTNIEEINTLETAAPDDKWILSANWANDNWATLLRATRYGETERVFDFGGGFTPTQTYDAEWSVDVDVQYNFASGLSLAVGANNLLDEYPDQSIYDISYFGNLPYDVIPPLGMNGRYIYARASYQF
jgi:iron complex outermembrane receptor protein